jgi:hypothetical protein
MKSKLLFRKLREASSHWRRKDTLIAWNKKETSILKAEEELWRQRSRAIWIHSGNQNTKFFHQFSSYRRNQKHVWEIKDDTGQTHSGQVELKAEAVNYFKNFFKAQINPLQLNRSELRAFSPDWLMRRKSEFWKSLATWVN